MVKPLPARYCTTNWSSYNASLLKWGFLLIGVETDMTVHARCDERPELPAVFSDEEDHKTVRGTDFPTNAIQFCLSSKFLFKLPLRQTAGMVASLLTLTGLDRPVPSFSTLCRTQQDTLPEEVPYRRADVLLKLLAGNTGINFLAGEA